MLNQSVKKEIGDLEAQIETLRDQERRKKEEEKKARVQKRYAKLIDALTDQSKRQISASSVRMLADRDQCKDFNHYFDLNKIEIPSEFKSPQWVIWAAYWMGREHGKKGVCDNLLIGLQRGEDDLAKIISLL